MRGWVYRSRGPPARVLKLENDLPQPTAESLGPHDVLVKVRYAVLFQGTAALMSQIPHFNKDVPWIPETTFSGIVISTGDQVDHIRAEDAVFGGFGSDVLRKYGGVLAEYVVLPDHVVVRKPSNVSLKGAACMGSSGVTAMQFVEVTHLKRGSRVLVTGASGGTGSLVVQAARATVGDEGLVVGTCSSTNEQPVKDLGAHEVTNSMIPMQTVKRLYETKRQKDTCLHTFQVIDYKTHPVLHEYLAEQ